MIEVSGTVVDITTGDGLPSATLSVNGKAVAAADSGGNFSVTVNSYNDTITASSIDYQSLTMPAYQVQESGLLQLSIDPDALQSAVVTASPKKKISPWWVLAGLAVVASTEKKPSRAVSGKGSSAVIPLVIGGGIAYLLLKPKTTNYSPYPSTYPNTTPVSSSPSGGSVLSPGNVSSVIDIFKDLFGSWNTSSANENTSSGTYSSYDPAPSGGDIYAGVGVGETTTVNAGDILGKTLVAAMKVPVYDQPNDSAPPSGYINAGQPVGIVFSYLSPNPSLGRSTLWWMFEPLPGNTDIGNDQGYYFAPHNPDYYNFQALADAGVLTVAQATALKNGTEPSTLEKLLDKYVPWVIGGLVAVGIGKAVLNKVI